jgi:hypothetical protein
MHVRACTRPRFGAQASARVHTHTHTHTDLVPIAFPRRQWLRYTYIVCPVFKLFSARSLWEIRVLREHDFCPWCETLEEAEEKQIRKDVRLAF